MKTLKQFIAMTDTMELMSICNRTHVLMPFERSSGSVNTAKSLDKTIQPNYMGTGCALVGVLGRKQTISQFKKKWIEGQMKIQDPEYLDNLIRK